MEKGKIKKERKYLSIVVVPHSTGKSLTFKISNLFPKFISITVILVFITSMFTVTYKDAVSENKRLKSSLASLESINLQQQKLITEKVSTIDEFNQKETDIKNYIDDFSSKFQEITNTYITNSTKNLTVSRSTDRSPSSFVSEINELRLILRNLEDSNEEKEDLAVDLSQTESNLKAFLDALPTLWPVNAKITSPFGNRNHPVYKRVIYHDGLDLGANYGDSIKAAGSGKIIFSGTKSGYGKCIMIDHGYNIVSLYGHCSSLLDSEEGQKVQKGDVIAQVGSTGTSTGPHLHYEVRVNDTAIDPQTYLDKR